MHHERASQDWRRLPTRWERVYSVGMADFTREEVIDTISSARKFVRADLRGLFANRAVNASTRPRSSDGEKLPAGFSALYPAVSTAVPGVQESFDQDKLVMVTYNVYNE